MHEKKETELIFLKNWAMAIVTFLAEGRENKALFSHKIKEIESLYEQKSLGKMALLYREIYSMASTSSLEARASLDKKLEEQFGKVLNDIKPPDRKKRKLNDEKLNELKFIEEWCLCILKYLVSQLPENANYKSIKKEDFFREHSSVITKAVELNDLRGMKIVYNDYVEWAKGLSKNQLLELNKIL